MPGEFSPYRVFVGVGVTIICTAFLFAIALPGRGRVYVPEARVAMEIKGLESAISAFKAKFGTEPPSRIILHERPTGHPYDLEGTDVHSRIEQRTVDFFRRIWPQFPVLTCQIDENGDGTVDRDWVDFNSNGKVDDELDMDGAECLVFFLGGIADHGVPIGFGRDARNPFSRGEKREGPFFELSDKARLIDRDGDGFLELIDTLEGQVSPYLYFSAYEGAGYNFHVDRETADNGAFEPYYMVGDPRVDRTQVKWYKPNSFQIISPGKDGKYGSGGLLTPENEPRTVPKVARDNITNFSAGRIEK